jgi:hypothetical protein
VAGQVASSSQDPSPRSPRREKSAPYATSRSVARITPDRWPLWDRGAARGSCQPAISCAIAFFAFPGCPPGARVFRRASPDPDAAAQRHQGGRRGTATLFRALPHTDGSAAYRAYPRCGSANRRERHRVPVSPRGLQLPRAGAMDAAGRHERLRRLGARTVITAPKSPPSSSMADWVIPYPPTTVLEKDPPDGSFRFAHSPGRAVARRHKRAPAKATVCRLPRSERNLQPVVAVSRCTSPNMRFPAARFHDAWHIFQSRVRVYSD